VLTEQSRLAQAHIKELNLPYNPASEADPTPRLDPLPYVLTQADQNLFHAAVSQFGSLLSKLYFDLWGPQNLVEEGLVPSGLLWGQARLDPAFFHAQPSVLSPLSWIRLDVSPGAGGTWGLLSLGTQIPRGLGYVLENRIVHSRFFGTLVPQENVERLAPFFQGLKDLWFHESRTHQDEPSIMVWTSGPKDPDYFEPVYLSRYFGYPLVESRDLTVRSGKVFLKTLGGLQPVDVLIRMTSDRTLDPLAGNPPGYGGVAGLLQAVRDQTVVVTNAPGSGLLEEPWLLGLLPKLCKRLLGEELILGPVGPAWPVVPAVFWTEGAWEPQTVSVQIFSARSTKGWELMPGGLVTSTDLKMRKDLWTIVAESVPQVSLLPARERPVEISRAAELPSRVADDLYWLGRYVERAWNDLRYLEKWWELKHGRGSETVAGSAQLVETLLVDLHILDEPPLEEVWNPGRLAETLKEIQRISGQVLDRLSWETHRLLKEFASIVLDDGEISVPETLRQLGLRLAAFHGLTMENMTRTPGWLFLDIGRRLERSDLILEGLEGFFRREKGEQNLGLVLELFDSILTYRTRYRLSPQRGPVLDLLLLDETNPRSLAFQILAVSRHVELLPRSETRAYRSAEERIVLDLLTRVRLCDALELNGEAFDAFLEKTASGLAGLAESLHQTYLAKIEPIESLQARGKDNHE
jgi:uncharacterized circularly permuted ATP-grasp superfamily protein/uncharacterized alpha-E superfamily protein